MGRHGDHDGDHLANQADPDYSDEQVLADLTVLDEDEHSGCASEACHIGDPTAYDDSDDEEAGRA